MNYSKTIKTYCLENKGSIFDVSYELDVHFNMIPYKTLLKILNRLEEQGIIKTISKGVFLINGGISNDEDPILKFYAATGYGLVLGEALLVKYGLLEKDIGNKKTILTTRMRTTTKNIDDTHVLFQYVSDRIDYRCHDIIEALEIIQVSRDYSVDDYKKTKILIDLLTFYSDQSLKEVLTKRHYQYSTICTLEVILNHMNVSNNCLEVCMGVNHIDD